MMTRLEQLLRADSTPVLEVLRFETEALLLRTRIVDLPATDWLTDCRTLAEPRGKFTARNCPRRP